MSDKIRLLPEVVANQIAAGEVVDRPSSVVKEMMENAIDAGAKSVKVNFRDGGRELIQIVDDGCGMSPIDARMAFDRHATSKISAVDDIYALTTFGFRGEALASIAAVAQVELRTRQLDAEVGTQTEINGGMFVAQTPVMCPVGSQFFVRNLFFNVPVRRTFLEKPTILANRIKTEFQRVALCNPSVGFELYANDAPLYRLSPSSLVGRIVDVVGRHIKNNLLELLASTSIASVEGYIGRPAAAKRRSSEQFLFINGRFFRSGYLNSAILKGYDKLIPEGAAPAYFLYINVDPARVDVNVHPQKTEVRFADEQAIWQIVNAAVRESLARCGAVSMMDFDSQCSVEIPVLTKGAVYREPSTVSNSEYNPFGETYIDPLAPEPNVDFTGFDVPFSDSGQSYSQISSREVNGNLHDLSTPISGVGARGRTTGHSSGYSIGSLGDGHGEEFDDFISSSSAENPSQDDIYISSGSELDFISSTSQPQQQRLEIDSAPRFSDVMALGGGYIASVYGGRLVVVDARRARERILFEHYRKVVGSGASACQKLLFPDRLVLSELEYSLLEENAVEFASIGFDLELMGDGAVEVNGTPADMPVDALDRLLYELLQAYAAPITIADQRRDRVAEVMARAGSKFAPKIVDREQAFLLLEQLAATQNVSFSPSGGQILMEISPEEIRAKLG